MGAEGPKPATANTAAACSREKTHRRRETSEKRAGIAGKNRLCSSPRWIFRRRSVQEARSTLLFEFRMRFRPPRTGAIHRGHHTPCEDSERSTAVRCGSSEQAIIWSGTLKPRCPVLEFNK